MYFLNIYRKLMVKKSPQVIQPHRLWYRQCKSSCILHCICQYYASVASTNLFIHATRYILYVCMIQVTCIILLIYSALSTVLSTLTRIDCSLPRSTFSGTARRCSVMMHLNNNLIYLQYVLYAKHPLKHIKVIEHDK